MSDYKFADWENDQEPLYNPALIEGIMAVERFCESAKVECPNCGKLVEEIDLVIHSEECDLCDDVELGVTPLRKEKPRAASLAKEIAQGFLTVRLFGETCRCIIAHHVQAELACHACHAWHFS